VSPPPTRPWGMSRLEPYRRTLPLPFARVELDPVTQTGRYFDASGEPVELGKHGTSRLTSLPTATGGDGAGNEPPPPSDSDAIEDTESD
jgi:putative ATP-grasp target RiPP